MRGFRTLPLLGVGLLGFLGIYNVLALGGYPFGLFHFLNLVPGLLGQLIFSLFGWFGSYIGGFIMQAAFPFSIFAYLFSLRRRFVSAWALFWAAQSLVDISFYIKDARALTYNLYWGTDHIWNRLLGESGLLSLDKFMGNVVYLSGVCLFFAALALALLAARKPLEPAALAEQGSF